MKWNGAVYDSVRKAPQSDAGRELIAMARVRERDRVLDMGCGTGRLSEELARLTPGGAVLCLDPSDGMLTEARKRLGAKKNVRFASMRAEDMDFSGGFDLVYSNSAIQWIKEQERVLSLAHRALDDRGRVAFQLPARDFCPVFINYVRESISDLGLDRHFEDWTSPWRFQAPEDMDAMLKRAGFVRREVFEKEYWLVFDRVSDVSEWWASAGLGPYLAALPERDAARFRYAFEMRFEYNRTSNGVEFGFKRLFALAER